MLRPGLLQYNLQNESFLSCAHYVFLCRYENEQPFRKAVEDEINSLYKVIDDANLTKMDLQCQIESMKEELGLLSKNHEEVSQDWGQCIGNVYLFKSGQYDINQK